MILSEPGEIEGRNEEGNREMRAREHEGSKH